MRKSLANCRQTYCSSEMEGTVDAVDLRIQESRCKGSKDRSLGRSLETFYYGVDKRRKGAAIISKEQVHNLI